MNVLFFYLVFSSEVFFLEKLKRLKTIGRDIFFLNQNLSTKTKFQMSLWSSQTSKTNELIRNFYQRLQIVDKPFSTKFYKLTKTQNDGGEIFVKICVNLSLISSHADTSFRNESNSKL